jgi:tetratricopeptide (TPR) repeat protein
VITMDENIVFISLEGAHQKIIGDFSIRDDVPFPLYVQDPTAISPDQITLENIMTGIISLVTSQPDHEHADYYKNLLLTIKPDIESQFTNMAAIALQDEKFDEAMEMYRFLLILNPGSLTYNLHIAVCYEEMANYHLQYGHEEQATTMEEIAFEHYKLVDSHPDRDAEACYHLGRFYLSRDNYQKALPFFEEFLSLSDDEDLRADVQSVIGQIAAEGIDDEDYQTAMEYFHADKCESAIGFINRYIERYPDSWHGHYLKGALFRKLGRYDDALISLEKAIDMNDQSPDIYNEEGLCYLNTGVFHKAEVSFYRALKIVPEDAAVLSNLAILSYRRGNIDEALSYCDVILDGNPEDLHTKHLKEVLVEVKQKNIQ